MYITFLSRGNICKTTVGVVGGFLGFSQVRELGFRGLTRSYLGKCSRLGNRGLNLSREGLPKPQCRSWPPVWLSATGPRRVG